MCVKFVLIAFFCAAVPLAAAEDLELVEERAWTLCLDSLWNSCVGRCGQRLSGPPYLCGCDAMCLAYNDCCLDFDYECTWGEDFNRTDVRNRTQLANTARMSCVGLSTTMEYGVLMISSCASWWPIPVIDKDDRNTTRSRCIDPDTSSLKPVMGVNYGEIYKNTDCAHCNGVRNIVVWPVDINCTTTKDNNSYPWQHQSWLFSCTVEMDMQALKDSNARACAYTIGECPVSSSSDEDSSSLDEDSSSGQGNVETSSRELVSSELSESCSSYSKPIMVMNDDQSMVIYKNVHCAQCNGHCIDNLYCPQWELHTRQHGMLDSSRSVYYETGVTADTRRGSIPNLPAAFSILFYYHQNGFQQNMFSSYSENWKEYCDENQIWDPFWETCRDVYCASQFTLENFHCVDNGNSNGGVVVNNSTYSNVTQFDNVDVSQVRLDMELQLQVPFNSTIEEILEKEFIDAISHMLNVTDNRFVNYTSYNKSIVNGSYTNQEEVSVVLLGPLEPLDPTIEKVVGTIAYGVSLDQLWLDLKSSGLLVRIFGIQEKIIQVTNSSEASNSTNMTTSEWCVDGRQMVYQNDQFTPLVIPYSASNKSLNIYINSTGETYLPGQFIANILMAGYQGSSLVNVSGAVIVCDESYHNNSCLRVMISRSDYRAFPNGTIEYIGNITEVSPNTYPPKDYEILPNGNALVCLTYLSSPTTYSFGSILKDLQAQGLLTTILLTISSTTIILTIVHYLLFSSLRNLPGWTILNLCISLLAFQLLYLGGMRFSVFLKHKLCYGVAVFLHWTILSAFFWMNVIAFDLFWTFSQLMTKPGTKRPLKTIFYYALYGYGMASLVVAVCVILDNFTSFNIGYATKGYCWIGDPKALAVVFAGVIGIVLLANFIFYCLTICSIRKMGSKIKINGASRSQMSVYIRMSALMGFTWALGYLEGVPSFSYTLHDVFAYAFIVSNCLAGVFIFLAMVCNRKALLLYRDSRGFKWLVRRWDKTFAAVVINKCEECKQTTENCNCPKTVIRTVSNETVQSIIEAEKEEINLEINETEQNNAMEPVQI